MLMIGNNLSKFVLDKIARDVLPAKSRQGVRGAFKLPFANVEPRRLGKKRQATGKNQGPYHLNGNGDPVGATVGTVLSYVVDGGGEQ